VGDDAVYCDALDTNAMESIPFSMS